MRTRRLGGLGYDQIFTSVVQEYIPFEYSIEQTIKHCMTQYAAFGPQYLGIALASFSLNLWGSVSEQRTYGPVSKLISILGGFETGPLVDGFLPYSVYEYGGNLFFNLQNNFSTYKL